MSTACGTNTHLSGATILFKYLVKKGHNSKTLAFRVMPLVLQQHIVMMSKNSKFSTNIFNTFLVMGYIKVFDDNNNSDNVLTITIAQLFLCNRQTKNLTTLNNVTFNNKYRTPMSYL